MKGHTSVMYVDLWLHQKKKKVICVDLQLQKKKKKIKKKKRYSQYIVNVLDTVINSWVWRMLQGKGHTSVMCVARGSSS